MLTITTEPDVLRTTLEDTIKQLTAIVNARHPACVREEPIVQMGVDRGVPWMRVVGKRIVIEVLNPEGK